MAAPIDDNSTCKNQNVILAGLIAGIGGAYFTVGSVGSFGPDMTSGEGYIALAAMIFGRWKPLGAVGCGPPGAYAAIVIHEKVSSSATGAGFSPRHGLRLLSWPLTGTICAAIVPSRALLVQP